MIYRIIFLLSLAVSSTYGDEALVDRLKSDELWHELESEVWIQNGFERFTMDKKGMPTKEIPAKFWGENLEKLSPQSVYISLFKKPPFKEIVICFEYGVCLFYTPSDETSNMRLTVNDFMLIWEETRKPN